MEPIDAIPDDAVVAPAHQPVCSSAIKEIVLAGPFPNEMPRVMRVHANGSAPVGVAGVERACGNLRETPLPVSHRVSVIAGGGRHEPDAKDVTVHLVAEALNLPVLRAAGGPKLAGKAGIHKGVVCIRGVHGSGDFHEIIGVDHGGRRRERDIPRRGGQAGR
jgi:hypothetical protein